MAPAVFRDPPPQQPHQGKTPGSSSAPAAPRRWAGTLGALRGCHLLCPSKSPISSSAPLKGPGKERLLQGEPSSGTWANMGCISEGHREGRMRRGRAGAELWVPATCVEEESRHRACFPHGLPVQPLPGILTVLSSAGSRQKPLDVRGPRGGGGPEGADQGADREEQPAGAGEQPPQDAGQPRAAGPAPSTAADHLLARSRPAARDGTAAAPAGLRTLGVAAEASLQRCGRLRQGGSAGRALPARITACSPPARPPRRKASPVPGAHQPQKAFCFLPQYLGCSFGVVGEPQLFQTCLPEGVGAQNSLGRGHGGTGGGAS